MREFPITKISPKSNQNKGYDILLEKSDGGHWKYSLKNELSDAEIQFLKIRQEQNWKWLAIAKFQTKTTQKGCLLHLAEIGV